MGDMAVAHPEFVIPQWLAAKFREAGVTGPLNVQQPLSKLNTPTGG